MRLPIACIVVLLPTSVWAVDATAFARCRAVTDPVQRLSCYDALRPVPAATPPIATAEQRFGLPASTADDASLITSHIPGRFDGWVPGSRLTLANGQVWQISDGSRGVFNLVDPKVQVRRGVVGSYFLEIEGQNSSPRVRRVR